jgi:AraC-like DNA-binding protein
VTRPVGYRQWAPPAALAAALDCFWVRLGSPAGALLNPVLPDGCVDLIWQEGRGAFIAGPDTGPVPSALAPETVLVGARFRPGAGGPALGVPLAALRDRRVDFCEIQPALSRRVPSVLDAHEALRRVSAVAAELVTASPPDAVVLEAVRLLVRPRTQLSELVAVLGVSERQLRRRFDLTVGYGPKTLQRVLRFRRVVDRLSASHGACDLATLAVRTGYADQAHLTRETSRLAGLPPALLARRFESPRRNGPIDPR